MALLVLFLIYMVSEKWYKRIERWFFRLIMKKNFCLRHLNI